MWREAAIFLLEVPPIEEIGGSITHTIEQYRAGTINKGTATQILLQEHKNFLEKYIETNELLSRE